MSVFRQYGRVDVLSIEREKSFGNVFLLCKSRINFIDDSLVIIEISCLELMEHITENGSWDKDVQQLFEKSVVWSVTSLYESTRTLIVAGYPTERFVGDVYLC
ncbi:MAG: hypothetical protein DSY70_05725 [Desulfobulbus sp.]|nr:MAG: hypothetical protein DSY70_05725 [Desulfobulbus sp.]